jgi:Rps23 Pro-64 3,4-dihydroxylase Tpa1-like proline 4-hydroxylase
MPSKKSPRSIPNTSSTFKSNVLEKTKRVHYQIPIQESDSDSVKETEFTSPPNDLPTPSQDEECEELIHLLQRKHVKKLRASWQTTKEKIVSQMNESLDWLQLEMDKQHHDLLQVRPSIP